MYLASRGGGIFRIPSERDDQSKDRKKIPRAFNKTKKKIPGQKNNQTIYSEFSNLRIHYSKREFL